MFRSRTPVLLACFLWAPGVQALANAKIVHVSDVVSAEPIPNPPASESEAASWHGHAADLPRVWRLESEPRVDAETAGLAAPSSARKIFCPAPSMQPAQVPANGPPSQAD